MWPTRSSPRWHVAWFAEPGWQLCCCLICHILRYAAGVSGRAPRVGRLAPATQRGTAFGWFNLYTRPYRAAAVPPGAAVLAGCGGVAAALAFGFSAQPQRCWRQACWCCGAAAARRLDAGRRSINYARHGLPAAATSLQRARVATGARWRRGHASLAASAHRWMRLHQGRLIAPLWLAALYGDFGAAA